MQCETPEALLRAARQRPAGRRRRGPGRLAREGVIVAERLPTAVIPVEALPFEKQATDFMTPETRPRDLRPREFRPA
jgi:hypothetical protein